MFAPSIGYAILIILALRLLAIFALLYIVNFIYKCVSRPDYLILVKAKPLFTSLKIGAMIVLIGFASFEFMVSKIENKRILKDIATKQAILNPILEQDTEINGILLPKGTQIESYNPKYNNFTSATFIEPYQFKNLMITYLENPDSSDANIKLHQATTIDGFECQATIKLRIEFDESNVWINDCRLAKAMSYKNIHWTKDSKVTTTKEKVSIRGDAEFTVENESYKQFLNYTYYRIKQYEVYKDKSGITLLNTSPGHRTVKDSNGEYSLKFTGLVKGVHYKITNRETGEVFTGLPDENGQSEKIVTDKPMVFDIEFVFVHTK